MKLTTKAETLLRAFGVSWIEYGDHVLVDSGCGYQLDVIESVNKFAADFEDDQEIEEFEAETDSWTTYCEGVKCAAHSHMSDIEAAEGLASLRSTIEAHDRRDIAELLRIGTAGE